MKITYLVKKLSAPLLVLGLFAMLSACNNAAGSSGGNENEKTPEDKPEVKTWDFEMGTFPQSKKAADVTIKENINKTECGITYYLGSDDVWYVLFNGDYYKVEPIKWRILDENYQNKGHKLVVADKILNSMPFLDCGHRQYSNENGNVELDDNDYLLSSIRAYLNGDNYLGEITEETIEADSWMITKYKDLGFLNIAFTDEERERIKNDNSLFYANPDPVVEVNKIFLLKEEDVHAYKLMEEDKRFKVTDYAYDAGCINSHWWTRSPSPISGNTKTQVTYVHQSKLIQYMTPFWGDGGVLPAMLID